MHSFGRFNEFKNLIGSIQGLFHVMKMLRGMRLTALFNASVNKAIMEMEKLVQVGFCYKI